MITNVVGIFGPVQAGFMCNWKVLGRRYTMVIGALMSMAFFFAYTAVRTASENLGFTCAIYYVVNIYYGTLYAYTPEVTRDWNACFDMRLTLTSRSYRLLIEPLEMVSPSDATESWVLSVPLSQRTPIPLPARPFSFVRLFTSQWLVIAFCKPWLLRY